MSSPGLPLAVDPQIGDVVIFKYRGQWVRGVVAGFEEHGERSRLSVRRSIGPGVGDYIHRRNRSQIYDPSRAAEPTR